jgi:activating signal cointegrator complex subunit 1
MLEELARLVPQFEELVSSAKVPLLQSIVSRILVETIFDAYFVGLTPEQTQQLQESEALIASLCELSDTALTLVKSASY